MAQIDLQEMKELGKRIHSVISSMDEYREPGRHTLELEDLKIGFGESYPIKATEKFLGYYDPSVNIAFNPSVSFSTDFSKCTAFCTYRKNRGKDRVFFNGHESEKYTARSAKALRALREMFRIEGHFVFLVGIKRRYREAKGFSESSAVAAAVARALVSCIFEEGAVTDREFVSSLARLVSGSGTRAVFDGFSIWESYAGISPGLSCAHPLKVDYRKLNFFAVPSAGFLPTDNAHRLAVESPFYSSWVREKIKAMESYLDPVPDIETLLKRGMEDSFHLHSILMSQSMPVFSERTFEVLKKIREFSVKNEGIRILMDTGPSVVVTSTDKTLLQEFREFLGMRVLTGSIPSKVRMKPLQRPLHIARETFDTIRE